MNFNKAEFELAAATISQLPKAELPEIVFSGRSNVGKSSLINKLTYRKSLARASATPGKTATVNFYKVDTARFVDLPGYGFSKLSKSEKARISDLVNGYFEQGRAAVVVQLIDMRHAPTADDISMIEYMQANNIPFFIVLTKADKLKKTQREQRLAALCTELPDCADVRVYPFSAVTGEGADSVRDTVASYAFREE